VDVNDESNSDKIERSKALKVRLVEILKPVSYKDAVFRYLLGRLLWDPWIVPLVVQVGQVGQEQERTVLWVDVVPKSKNRWLHVDHVESQLLAELLQLVTLVLAWLESLQMLQQLPLLQQCFRNLPVQLRELERLVLVVYEQHPVPHSQELFELVVLPCLLLVSKLLLVEALERRVVIRRYSLLVNEIGVFTETSCNQAEGTFVRLFVVNSLVEEAEELDLVGVGVVGGEGPVVEQEISRLSRRSALPTLKERVNRVPAVYFELHTVACQRRSAELLAEV